MESFRHSLTNLDPDYVEQIVTHSIEKKKNNLKKGRGYFDQQSNPNAIQVPLEYIDKNKDLRAAIVIPMDPNKHSATPKVSHKNITLPTPEEKKV